MTVMLAGVELPGVQKMNTVEERTIVEHRVPGMDGSVLQDLGRGTAVISIEGILHGEKGLEGLEKLREEFKAGQPVVFSADISTGTDIVDVLIKDLRVWQVAGYKDRYRYSLMLCEYTEPPAPPSMNLEAVEMGIALDAANWSGDVFAAAGALQNPVSLPGLLASRPGLLDHLSAGDVTGTLGALGDQAPGKMAGLLIGQPDLLGRVSAGDLGGIIAQSAAGMTGNELTGVLGAVGNQDPGKMAGLLIGQPDLLSRVGAGDLGGIIAQNATGLAGSDFSAILRSLGDTGGLDTTLELLNAVKSGGGIGELVQKYADEGLDIVKDLTGLDPDKLPALVKEFAGGANFLKLLKDVGNAAGALIEELKDYDPLQGLRSLVSGVAA